MTRSISRRSCQSAGDKSNRSLEAVTNLIPFLVIRVSWGILGEPIRWYHAVGATVVIAAVVLTTRR